MKVNTNIINELLSLYDAKSLRELSERLKIEDNKIPEKTISSWKNRGFQKSIDILIKNLLEMIKARDHVNEYFFKRLYEKGYNDISN